jgi:hypothetical protein
LSARHAPRCVGLRYRAALATALTSAGPDASSRRPRSRTFLSENQMYFRTRRDARVLARVSRSNPERSSGRRTGGDRSACAKASDATRDGCVSDACCGAAAASRRYAPPEPRFGVDFRVTNPETVIDQPGTVSSDDLILTESNLPSTQIGRNRVSSGDSHTGASFTTPRSSLDVSRRLPLSMSRPSLLSIPSSLPPRRFRFVPTAPPPHR